MKNPITFLATLAAIVVTTQLKAQAPEIEWQNTIGGSDFEYCRSIVKTNDGGFILGGYSKSGISGDKTEACLGNYDFWVVKINSTGSIEWQNTIGGSVLDENSSIVQTADGGYFMGGWSESNISGDKTEASLGGKDYWVVKLNSSGAIEWQNTIGGSGSDYLRSLQQTTDGGYILGGYSLSGISGDKTEASFGLEDFWVVKLNSSGAIEWQSTIGGSGADFLHSIAQTDDDGYILGGYSLSGISGDKTEASMGFEDYWVVKLNSTGGIEWQNTIGGTGGDFLFSISQTEDNGYILGGYSSSGISGDKMESNEGETDYWAIKLNSSGMIEWQNTIGGSLTDNLYFISQIDDGGYILGGYSWSSISGDKTEVSRGQWDYWIVQLDSSGMIRWQKTLGGSAGDNIKSIVQTDDGGYTLCGHSYSYISGDKTETNLGGGYSDLWIIKLEGCALITEVCNSLDDNCNGLIDDFVVTISISAGGATTFCQGGSVVLTASHTGTSLQWKKNGVNIAGATGSTFTVTKIGEYTCETTSACGNEISNAIVVTVNKNPKAIIAADGPTTFCAGDDVTLTVTPVGGSTYQWYNGASAIAGATTTSYVASTAGNYKCRVTKTATGCFKNSSVIAVAVTCREGEIITENTFQIYPNPADNILTIETNLSTEKTIYITNTHGQLVQTIQSSENIIHIDLNHLSGGMYFIKMEDAVFSQTQIFTKK